MSWLFRSQSQQKNKDSQSSKQKRQPEQPRSSNLNQRDSTFYAENQVQLPPTFAQDLMELEIEMELPSVTIDQITRLLTLYQQGVEYFSTIKSDKYLVFKNKSQSLLLRPNVINVLNSPTKQCKTEESSQPQFSTMKQHEFKNNLKHQDPQEQVQRFLNSHRSEVEKIDNLINNDLTDQQKRLEARIGQRKKNTFQFSRSSSMMVMEKAESIPTSCGLGDLETQHFMKQKSESQLPKLIVDDELRQKLNMIKSVDNINSKEELNLTEVMLKIQKLATEEQPVDEPQNKQIEIQEEENKSQEELIQPIKPIVVKPYDSKAAKEQRIRQMVSQNKELQRQKMELLQKNNVLPF